MTDVERERIPLLWSTVGKTALAKGFCSSLRDTKYPCVCRRTQLLRRDAHGEKRNRQEMSQRSCDRQLTGCSLFWPGWDLGIGTEMYIH